MTDQDPGEPPVVDEQATTEPIPIAPSRRLRALPAFAVASMLVAGGLLMAVGGMVRLVGPAPPTPTPTVAPTPAATPTPALPPASNPLGPTAPPHGVIAPRTNAV
jgi:hypothetical protein